MIEVMRCGRGGVEVWGGVARVADERTRGGDRALRPSTPSMPPPRKLRKEEACRDTHACGVDREA